MVDAPEPAAGETSDREDARPTARPRSRTLDRRTVAICACIAIVAALAAGLVASMAMGDDEPAGTMSLSAPTEVNTARLLAQPLDTPDGATSNLGAHLDEQPMLVNLWQSTCVPCVDEMPLLEQAEADNPDVTFVGVATQDKLPDAKKLAAQTKITYPWLLDPTGELYYESKGSGMPTTLLLSADGDVLASKTGAFDDAAELQAFIDERGG